MGKLNLFECQNELPDDVQQILLKYSEMDSTYENCEMLLNELKPLGYTFEYGLDAIPFNLTKIESFIHTEIGKSYWNETGKYQQQYSKLYEKLVPRSGSAETLNGELVRAISRLQYEYCNNGNCNACEVEYETETLTCSSCGGSGECEGYENEDGELVSEDCGDCYGSGEIEEEVEGESTINAYYQKFLNLISENVPDTKHLVEEIEFFIKGNNYHSVNQFSDLNMYKYTLLFDKVIYYVMNNQDKQLPENYEKN